MLDAFGVRLRSQPSALALRGYFKAPNLDPSELIISWERPVLPGYGWLFPMSGGRANVGVGILAAQLTSHRQWLDRYAGQLYHLATSATWEWIWRHLRQFFQHEQAPRESAASEEDDA